MSALETLHRVYDRACSSYKQISGPKAQVAATDRVSACARRIRKRTRRTRLDPVGRSLAKIAWAATTLGMTTLIMTEQTSSGSTLAASPTSGTAPLVVTFTGTGSGSFEGVMLLDFGDGQTDGSISTIRDFTRTHTYAVPGSYTVHLKSGGYGGQRPSILTIVGSVTIIVH
jgi:PKD domain-containing protein